MRTERMKEQDRQYKQSDKGKACRARRVQRTFQLILEAKNRPCVDCGKQFHRCQMEFDHRLGEVKSFGLNCNKGRSLKRVQNEIAKCDVVCCLCHKVRTWNRVHPEDLIS